VGAVTLAAVGIPWVDRLLGDLPAAFAFLLAVIIMVSAVGALVLGLLARRSRTRESREIVRLLEEMRAGRPKARIDLDSRSPYAAIAESANRLGQDLAVRWTRGEAAHEGFERCKRPRAATPSWRPTATAISAASRPVRCRCSAGTKIRSWLATRRCSSTRRRGRTCFRSSRARICASVAWKPVR
jgi:hypothetical protein